MNNSFLKCLLLCFISAGCFTGCGIDQSDINKVVQDYYRPNKPQISAKDSYKYLSSKSRESITLQELENYLSKKKSFQVIDAKPLQANSSGGQKIMTVSVKQTFKDDKDHKYTDCETDSWVLEKNKWRLVAFPFVLLDEYSRAWKSGDYATAMSKAEEMLEINPYSIFAYTQLYFCMDRLKKTESRATGRTSPEIIRAVLNINPDDTTALFLGATAAENSTIAKSYVDKLNGSQLFISAVSNVAHDEKNDSDRLKFLNEINTDDEDIIIIKMSTLANLEKWADFKALAATDGNFERLKTYLDEKDATFAAGRAGRLGICCLRAGDKADALLWLKNGISRDPNNSEVKKLSEAVK